MSPNRKWIGEIEQNEEMKRIKALRDLCWDTGIITMWPDFDHTTPDWDAVFKLGFPDFSVAHRNTRKSTELPACLRYDGVFYMSDDGSIEPLYDTEKFDIKYANDMKVGPDGRLYVGTMSGKRKGVSDELDGKLYSIDRDGNVKILLDGLILSTVLNGRWMKRNFTIPTVIQRS